MNHQLIYKRLIEKAKSQNRIKLNKTNSQYVYYETHHILPKCLKGGDEKENLVLLTAKEHFICHKLLTYIHSRNRKIALAFHKMAFSTKHNELVSGKDFQYARELLSLTPISQETRKKLSISLMGRPFAKKGIPLSKERKEQISIATSGKNNGMYAKKHIMKSIEKNRQSNLGKKQSEETKRKMSESHKGFKHSEEFKLSVSTRHKNKLVSVETRKKISESMKGEKHYLFGKHRSEKTKKKMSESQKGIKHKVLFCSYCGKKCSPSTLVRWHEDNCKSKV